MRVALQALPHFLSQCQLSPEKRAFMSQLSETFNSHKPQGCQEHSQSPNVTSHPMQDTPPPPPRHHPHARQGLPWVHQMFHVFCWGALRSAFNAFYPKMLSLTSSEAL